MPSIANARWRAHSLRFCVGAQSCVTGCAEVMDCMPAGQDGSWGPFVTTGIAVVLAISISGGREMLCSGALKMRRPDMAPPIRLPSEPAILVGGWVESPGTVVAWPFAARRRMRLICRSRRTMTFVMLMGQSPLRSALCLHMGHREELLRRKVSIQSGWKMWRQGSSRTWVSPCSKSSRQIGQVGCSQVADAVALAGTVDADE